MSGGYVQRVALQHLSVNRVQLVAEAKQALSDLSAAEWIELLAFSSTAAAVGTVHSKVTGIARLVAGIGRLGTTTRARVGEVGLREAAKSSPRALRVAATTRVMEATDRFMGLRDLDGDTRRQVVADTLIAGVTAWFVAGGADLEGGIPDLDLVFGVGNHRNPFSHSLILGLSVEGGMRFTAAALSRVYAHLPEQHSRVWDWALETFDKTYEAVIVGVWFGSALHLLNDVGLPGARTKPYVMLPVSLTNAGHQALLASSAAASACLGFLTSIGKRDYTVCAAEAVVDDQAGHGHSTPFGAT